DPAFVAPVRAAEDVILDGESVRIGRLEGRLLGAAAAPIELRAGAHADLDLTLPLAADRAASGGFAEALAAVRGGGHDLPARGVPFQFPDARMDRLARGLLAQQRLFVREGRLRYGAFPSVYEGAIFGVEEGWNIVALGMFGHAALAADLLTRTFF